MSAAVTDAAVARSGTERLPLRRCRHTPIRILAATETFGNARYERLRARAMILLLRYYSLRVYNALDSQFSGFSRFIGTKLGQQPAARGAEFVKTWVHGVLV